MRINGKPAILGQKADPAVDMIEVDGAIVQERKEMLYYVMHKPVGVETTNVDRESGDREIGKKKGQEGQKGRKVVPSRCGIYCRWRCAGKCFPSGGWIKIRKDCCCSPMTECSRTVLHIPSSIMRRNTW